MKRRKRSRKDRRKAKAAREKLERDLLSLKKQRAIELLRRRVGRTAPRSQDTERHPIDAFSTMLLGLVIAHGNNAREIERYIIDQSSRSPRLRVVGPVESTAPAGTGHGCAP